MSLTVNRHTFGARSKKLLILTEGAREIAAKACEPVMRIIEQAALNNITIEKMHAWAMQQILDRGMGKPTQSIELSAADDDGNKDPANMTSEQLEMLFTGKAIEFITSIHRSGQLKNLTDKLDAGWEPGMPEPQGVIEGPIAVRVEQKK